MFAYLTGAGLAASAGLNAYIPLLIVGLLSRFTDAIALPAGYDWMADWWALAALVVLLCVEFVVDKVPVVDHVNDIIQTLVRPAAGGAVAAAATAASQLDDVTGTAAAASDNPVVGWALGIILALGVHAAKALLRTMINAGSAGLGTPVASVVEDTGSAGLSLLSIVAPILAGIVLLCLAVGVWRLWRRWRRWKRRRAERKARKVAIT